MMLIVVWALVGALMGICLVIVIPWTAARIAGRDWIESVSGYYVYLAQTAARRSALIVRDGSIQLVAKRYDPDLKADKDSASGDKRHHRDDFDALTRLKKKVFGIGLTSRDAYVSPLLAELGEATKTALERNEIGHEKTKGAQDKMVDGILIPERSQLVDIAKARHLTTGSAEPEDGQEAYEKTKISQEKFHSRVSFGQGLLIILAAIGSMAVTWFGASRGGGSPTPDVSVSTLALLAIPVLDPLKQFVRKFSTLLYVLFAIVAVPAIATLTYGLLTGAVVTGMMLLFALLFSAGIVLFGPSLPTMLGMPIARGYWILAQLTVGRGVLVERASGELEHRMLREAPADADHDYETTLSDGKTLEIEGSKGDLFRFAWAPLGACAEKSAQNIGQITEDIPAQAATDGGEVLAKKARQGFQPALRVADDDEWLVTLPQLWTWCDGASESDAVRQGRNKALTEHGGQQQISMLVFFAMILAAIVVGGLFGLIAGGAIL